MVEPYLHSPMRLHGAERTLLTTLCVYVVEIQERVFVWTRRVDVLEF
jgi:hypothetical protein